MELAVNRATTRTEVALERELEAYLAAVERRLADVISELRLDWERRCPDVASGLETLERFVLDGGKRIRPSFVFCGFAAGRAETGPAVVDVGAAIELLHAFALIHDDVMDDSDTRRHHPTVHRSFAVEHERGRWRGERRRVSEAFAVLLGDLALVLSTRLQGGLPPGVVRILDTMRVELHFGQYLDLLGATTGRCEQDEIDMIVRFKTARYTVVRPLQIGATLAGARQHTAALTTYGAAVGEAFQHRDDLLGVFGDPAVTGKPRFDDLLAGKSTSLIRAALDLGPTPDCEPLRRLGTPGFGPGDAAAVAEHLDRCGARATVERRIDRLVRTAVETIEASSLAPPLADLLIDRAITAGRRTR